MKNSRSPQELYQQREQRLRDALALKEPDRIPFVLTINYFPARYIGGLTNADAFTQYDAWREATKKTIVGLEPDLYSEGAGGSGSALSLLGPKLFQWPGGGLGVNALQQFIEGEPLKAEEYDQFLSDPGDYTLRSYLPRVWKALEPLAKLPPLQSLWGPSTMAAFSVPFGDPEIIKAFAALTEAGKEQGKYMQSFSDFGDEMANLGFPALQHGHAPAPFDMISDHLRGMRGTMLDMYRYPDKLKRACELVLPRAIASGLMAKDAKQGQPKRVGSALHRGSDGFMSLKQFDEFYWPTLKRLMETTTGAGLVHIPFYEGDWAQRLEHLLELPKGKTIARFALTDLAKAKAVLKDHTCIMGGVPHTLLQVASPSEVEDYCKKLIKTCGKGGGFIFTTSTGITNEAKPENVKAMIDTVKKYGVY